MSNIWIDFAAGTVAGCCGTPLYHKDGGVVAFLPVFDDRGVSDVLALIRLSLQAGT